MRYDMQKFLEFCGYDSKRLSLPKYFIKFDSKMEFDVFISQLCVEYPNAKINVPNNVDDYVYVYDYGGASLMYTYVRYVEENIMSAKLFVMLDVNTDDLLDFLDS